MPVTPLVLLIYALAVARLTGLIVEDDILSIPRDALLGWLDPTPKSIGSHIATLITCYWCMSIWVAAVVAPLMWWHGMNPYILLPAVVLAFAQVTGMISQNGR
jgi:hypothetical protein